MEIHQLRCFLRVAHEGHFGRAAESLHMTPSPVSRAVKALEAELGTLLFDRSHHSIRLTPAGRTLALGAETLLEEFDELARTVAASADRPHTPIALGGTPIAPPVLIDRAAELIGAATHGGDVLVNIADWEETLDRVGRNVFDIALYGLPFDEPAVDHRTVASLEMHVAIRADDPLADQDSVTWRDLREHWLTIPPRTQHRSSVNWIRDQSERSGHHLVDEVLEQDVIVLATHVRANRGRFFLALPPGIGGPWKILDDPAFVILPFREDSPVFELCLVWNRRRYTSDPAMATIVDHVLEHWSGQQTGT
jgi:DNA-binding transcriptional LysR family regulator